MDKGGQGPPFPANGDRPARLAEGIDLVGEYEGSGFKEPQFIARRADGQVIQLTELLHLVASAADGRRSYEQMAKEVSARFDKQVSADNVEFLVEKKLRPLGVLAQADGSTPELDKPDPLLALKFRAALVPEGAVQVLAKLFRPLFWPPVQLVLVGAFAVLMVWLLFVHGVGQSVRGTIYDPVLLVLFFGLVVVSTAFHEIGHASACKYGGARPGVLGAGVYIVWPVFYCDVTDAYRLDRKGRLRTDLGGIYFNAIFALGTAAVYFATSFEPLLVVVLLQAAAMLQQLMPLLRLDGYYVMSDLTGVPDILTRIRPILRSLVPGRDPDERVKELKPWVRAAVSGYVLTLIPLLLFSVVFMAIGAPRMFATAWDSLGVQWDKLTGGAPVEVTAAGIQMVALALPCLGIVATSTRICKRFGVGCWRWSAGNPQRRAFVVTAGAAAIGVAAFTWWPNGEYRPIQPGEKATVQGALAAVRHIPSGRPSLTAERQQELGGAPSDRDLIRSGERDRPRPSGNDPDRSSVERREREAVEEQRRERERARQERDRAERERDRERTTTDGQTTQPAQPQQEAQPAPTETAPGAAPPAEQPPPEEPTPTPTETTPTETTPTETTPTP